MKKLSCERLIRLDVNFKIDESVMNLDGFIGRTAHILLMECEPMIKMIILRYYDTFFGANPLGQSAVSNEEIK